MLAVPPFPNLAAKPIIDIDLIAQNEEKSKEIIQKNENTWLRTYW